MITFASRAPHKQLKYIRHSLPFAKLYSSSFNSIVGDTTSYDKVFIHQFTPLLYRWVATHDFKMVNWMVWGADLYNLIDVKAVFHKRLTLAEYMRWNVSMEDLFYHVKVLMLSEVFRKRAYEKVKNILTWMTTEYDFALQHISSL